MQRPLLMRYLPERLRLSAYWRLYHHRAARFPELFESAALVLAPGRSMHDLVPGDVISGNIAFCGIYEAGLSRRLLAHARAGGVLLDVGANMGYFSLLWAGAHPQNRVIALEASPGPARLLANNLRRNGLEGQVQLVVAAASDAAGTLRFAVGPADQTGWGGITKADGAHGEVIEVAAVTLDELLDELLPATPVQVMKMDVEGAEALVLAGSRRLLAERGIETIYYECNRERLGLLGCTPEDIHRPLRDCGYACEPLDRSGFEWMAHRPH